MFVHLSLNESKLHSVAPNLFYGDLNAGHRAPADAAVVHACKDPCHKQAVGYDKKIEDTHPDYLSRERGPHLYLNMIDPPVPLFKREMFVKFFEFVDRQIAERPVVIHCNQGRSRAPSLTLLYMAKRMKLLPDTDYLTARRAFEQKFPYEPGKGIETYLSSEWSLLGA